MRRFAFAFVAFASIAFTIAPAFAGQDLRTRIHDWVMEEVDQYKGLYEPKVMAVCINWRNEDGKISIRNVFMNSTAISSDGPIFVTSLESRALHICEEWRNSEQKECVCQMLDRNGQNVLELP